MQRVQHNKTINTYSHLKVESLVSIGIVCSPSIVTLLLKSTVVSIVTLVMIRNTYYNIKYNNKANIKNMLVSGRPTDP